MKNEVRSCDGKQELMSVLIRARRKEGYSFHTAVVMAISQIDGIPYEWQGERFGPTANDLRLMSAKGAAA
jgi:hypothetical protein